MVTGSGSAYGWANPVLQEFGPCGLLETRSVTLRALAEYRVAIVPASVHGLLGTQGWLTLREFAAGGGTVVVEGRGVLKELGLPDSLPLRPVPADAESSGCYRILASALARQWPPGAWPPRATRYHQGALLLIDAPLARTVTEFQQGLDSASLPLRKSGGEWSERLRPSADFCADSSLRSLVTPAMDGLEQQLGSAVMAAAPLPRLWLGPDGSQGAFIVTHDTELSGDASSWMAADVKNGGEPSTFFLADTGFTRQGIVQLESLGVDLGFHWDRTISGSRLERLGRFRLFRRERPPEEQLAHLREMGFRPGPQGLINRNHHLLMEGPVKHYRQMAALNVRLDSSNGPDHDGWGYPFATQFPFHPLDENGYPFDLLELPYQYADYYGGVDSSRIQAMILHCAHVDHGGLVALYHPNLFIGRGDVEAFASWRRCRTWARQAGLWVGTVSGYLDFVRGRSQATLRSSWSDPRLRVEARVEDDRQSLVLPRQWQGRVLSSVRAGPSRLEWQEVVRWGEPLALIRLSAGESHLEAEYALPR